MIGNPVRGAIYSEWLFTVRNWKSLLLPVFMAGIFMVQGGLLSGRTGPSFSTFTSSFPILFVMMIMGGRATQRVTEDISRGTGTIYLRTLVPTPLLMVVKWAFETVLLVVLLLGYVMVAMPTVSIGPTEILYLASTSGATVMFFLLLFVLLPASMVPVASMVVVFTGMGSRTFLLAAGGAAGNIGYVVPWAAAMGIVPVFGVRPLIPFAVIFTMLAEIIVMGMICAVRYRSVLLRRL